MTLFSDVYVMFLRKIKDIELANNLSLNTNVAENEMFGFLESSIIRFDRCKQDLSYDKTSQQFTNSILILTEKEILALFMIVEWLRPMVNSVLSLKNYLNDKEFTNFSNANFLDKKQALLKDNEGDAYAMMGRYVNNNININDFN